MLPKLANASNSHFQSCTALSKSKLQKVTIQLLTPLLDLVHVQVEKFSSVTSTPQPNPPSHLSVKGWAIYWPPLDAYCQYWRKYEGGLSLLFSSSLIMTYLPLSPITHTTNYLDLTEKSIAYLHWFLWLPPLIVSSCLGSALTWKGLWLPDAFRTT